MGDQVLESERESNHCENSKSTEIAEKRAREREIKKVEG